MHGGQLLGYCEPSRITCRDTSRSRDAFVVISDGGPVSWESELLGNASLNCSESEYMGFSTAAQEGVHGEQAVLCQHLCSADGSGLLPKHASVTVVRYNKKLIGMM